MARDALLDLRHPPLYLGAREVLAEDTQQALLNLLPSIATLGCVSRPIIGAAGMKRAHTLRMAVPLSLRKSAIVL